MRLFADVGLCGTGGFDRHLMCWSSAVPAYHGPLMGRHLRASPVSDISLPRTARSANPAAPLAVGGVGFIGPLAATC